MPVASKAKKTDKQPVEQGNMQSRALRTAEEMRKKYSDPSAVMDSTSAPLSIKWFHSGSIGVDIAVGQGFPEGRIIEIYGNEGGGKTTLALAAAGFILSQGEPVLFVDTEQAFSPDWARLMGVDVSDPNFFITQPNSAEQALDILEEFIKAGAIRYAILDSVAALVPQAELEQEIGDASVALVARLLSKELRQMVRMCNENHVTVAFINQVRDKMNMMGYGGDPTTTTGGKALKFYSSVRIEVKRIQVIKAGEKKIANRIKATIKKNKVSPPFKEVEFDIDFTHGLSILGEVIDYGVDLKFIEKRGAFFKYGEQTLGQGRENAKAFLRENQDMAREIHNKINVALGLPEVDQYYSYELNKLAPAEITPHLDDEPEDVLEDDALLEDELGETEE